jgi:hypothetical protein
MANSATLKKQQKSLTIFRSGFFEFIMKFLGL